VDGGAPEERHLVQSVDHEGDGLGFLFREEEAKKPNRAAYVEWTSSK